ncbi:MAG TPA: hypothetical protein EYP59_03255 [Thiotrichaceae bacterium]|nr:hypothetical protein [Thiotrichaceae bacterium]
MKIKWRITSVYGKQSFETEHQVYVTFKEPFFGFNGFLQDLNTLYLTSLHLATSNAGAKKESEVINNTWKHFQGKSVQTWGSPPNQKKRRLSYYKRGKGFVGTCDASSLETFLIQQEKQSGECGTFAKLFMAALAANGIQSEYVTISASDEQKFLVKEWRFNEPTLWEQESDYKWELTLYGETTTGNLSVICGMVPNQYDPDDYPMPLGNYKDLNSLSGIRGQNEFEPSEKIFDFHFIVKVPQSSGAIYYDPSYGVTYVGGNKLIAAMNFEKDAIAGYAKKREPEHPGYPYRCAFKARKPQDASGNYIGNIHFDK